MILFEHFWERFSERIIQNYSRREIKKEIEHVFDQELYEIVASGREADDTSLVAFYLRGFKCLAIRRNTTGDLITILPQGAREYGFKATINAFLSIWNEMQRRKYVISNKKKVHKGKSIISKKTRKRKPIVHLGSSIIKK